MTSSELLKRWNNRVASKESKAASLHIRISKTSSYQDAQSIQNRVVNRELGRWVSMDNSFGSELSFTSAADVLLS
jgi:hypothetical protein